MGAGLPESFNVRFANCMVALPGMSIDQSHGENRWRLLRDYSHFHCSQFSFKNLRTATGLIEHEEFKKEPLVTRVSVPLIWRETSTGSTETETG